MQPQAIKSPFVLLENRLRLAWLIRNNGFTVRMHGYEYLVSYGNRFLCLILLQPLDKSILIKEFKWIEEARRLVERILQLIKTIDEDSKILIYQAGEPF